MRLAIDTARCTGHGRCWDLVPELFDADDSGYGTAKTQDVPTELEERARVAARNCPEAAITITT
jgi:ferredoxin